MNRTSVLARLAALLTATAALVQTQDASAVGTRTFRLDTLEELKGGELEGTSVDSLGRVRAGLVLGSLPMADASAVWCSLVMPDGSVLLGTGNDGKVFRVQGGQVSEYATTGQMAVTSLALDAGGKVVAGTIPNGKVFTLEGQGAAKELVSLPGTEHVWALALDPKTKAVFAATGPEGKLFRLAAGGTAQVHFDSEEAHLISLVAAPDGTLFAGSSGNALLFRITGPGRATVMHDFPGDDVKALALAADGRLYAIANEHVTAPTIPRTNQSNADKSAGPGKADRSVPKPGKGRLVRFDTDGRAEEMLFDGDTHFQSLAIGDDGLPYVGTAKDGEVYAVDDARTSMLMADTPERQVGALVVAGRTKFVATTDPAVFHPVRSVGGPDAVWNSPVLDAGLRAAFGRLEWRATGPVELSTRTGNTEKPDASWSAWSNPLAAPGKVASPPSRYLQVRARFSRDPSAVLREITAHFVTDNARAVVTSVTAGEPASTETKKSDSVPESGGDLPEAKSKVKLNWKVNNTDNDTLRFRLFYRFEDSSVWRPILPANEILSKTTYDWDTAGLPEGTYRIKVEASDELANPPDHVLRHSLESGTVLVDNTPPVLQQLTVAGKKIRGTAVDGVGPIARIDVAVDPNPNLWLPFFPSDGVFDERSERFELDVSSLLATGTGLVAVRVSDAAGNRVVRTVEVR
jgi:hypothetical protein